MKILKNLAVCLAVLALGAVTVKSNEPGTVPGKATIRTVHGTASYELNGATKTLKPNMELPAGTVITTGPDSEVYMSVNGITSAVKVSAETSMAIPKMDKIGKGSTAESETMLDLRSGTILGQVKKVTGNSTYEIKTPRGVAGIRGTDFKISVSLLPGGGYSVTFSSITGQVFVSANVGPGGGTPTSVTLHDGQEFTASNALGAAVITIATVIMTQYNAEIAALLNVVVQPNNVGSATTEVRPVFPGGTPPTTSPAGFPPVPSGGLQGP